MFSINSWLHADLLNNKLFRANEAEHHCIVQTSGNTIFNFIKVKNEYFDIFESSKIVFKKSSRNPNCADVKHNVQLLIQPFLSHRTLG